MCDKFHWLTSTTGSENMFLLQQESSQSQCHRLWDQGPWVSQAVGEGLEKLLVFSMFQKYLPDIYDPALLSVTDTDRSPAARETEGRTRTTSSLKNTKRQRWGRHKQTPQQMPCSKPEEGTCHQNNPK